MKITIHCADPNLDARAHEYVERRLEFALEQFAESIDRINVALEDGNGPRGGIDQFCRVRVVISGRRAPVVGEGLHEVMTASIDLAAERVRRSIVRMRTSERRREPCWPE